MSVLNSETLLKTKKKTEPMGTQLVFSCTPKGNFRLLSWSLYNANNQVMDQGEYKVWRFNDLLYDGEVDFIEDAYDVQYVKDLLQDIIDRHQPKVVGNTLEEWEDFTNYASWRKWLSSS